MLKYIYPDICFACKKQYSKDKPLCSACTQRITPIELKHTCTLCHAQLDTATQLCSSCLQHPPAWQQSSSAFEFQGLGRELLLRFKYSRHLYLLPFLSQQIEISFQEAQLPEPDIITYVPMHPFKKLYRGWNQSELIAREFAKYHPQAECLSLLKRNHLGKAQASKARRERLKSVKDLFSIKKRDKIKDRSILLIDDILTTGATLDACCKALQKEMPKEISILTIARG
ncbi:ComF family protein [Lentisphaera profundi]|uniref:ComF family protein n=1 Tax=Lentisphaera profundi TaxID=1658616 RepID=A0ABY7VVR9_9BACT|nr:ComF family protein [Lentisphaera profundi]WDE97996.1 ComF family protein [Lentisphaera profundi]